VEGLQLPSWDPRKDAHTADACLAYISVSSRMPSNRPGSGDFAGLTGSRKRRRQTLAAIGARKAAKTPNNIHGKHDGKEAPHAKSGDFHRLVAIANEGEGQWWFRCLHTDILTVQKSA